MDNIDFNKPAHIDWVGDKYYQVCWTVLKAMKPRMAKLMDQIEAETLGVKVTKKPKKKPEKKDVEKKEDAEKKQEPVVV